MYRQHENPYELENRLMQLEAIKRRMKEEEQYDIDMEIEELKDRIRFAWDDDEYDSNY